MYRGHTDVWGVVKMYERVYRCIGHTDMRDVWGHTNIKGAYRCMGVYRCVGDVQKYGEHTDIWGFTYVGGHTDNPKTYRQPDIPPHSCQLPGCYISHKI